MNVDGSAQTRLTTTPGALADPSWSPDGTKMVFERDGSIYVLDLVGGAGQPDLTPAGGGYDPSFSADGQKIVFFSARDGNYEIYVMNADGSAQTNLTNFFGPCTPGVFCGNSLGDDVDPSWSPDGSRIAFKTFRDGNGEIYLMRADGTGLTRLTNDPADDGTPVWSPDGQQIVFERKVDANVDYHLYTMRSADGGAVTQITGGVGGDYRPSWQPALKSYGLVAAAGNGSASVSWLTPASDGGSLISSYDVVATPGGATTTVGGTTTTALVAGLSNNTPYRFTVTAHNASGAAAISAVSNSVIPQAGASPPVTVTSQVPPGGTLTTDPGTGPTPSLPVTSSVTMPTGLPGGVVSIAQGTVTETAPPGFTIVGRQIQISAPTTDPSHPLVITFTLDSSAAAGQTAATLQIDRTEANGSPTPVPDCTGSPGIASPDPCISNRTTLAGGDIQVSVLTSRASVWNLALDTTPPSITFTTPLDEATYKLHQVVNASYSCTDQGSGIAVCAGPVSSGGPIDTSSVGQKTFAVNARDKAGNPRVVTHAYNVVFDFSGFFSPVSNPPALNTVKAGKVVTMSFSLAGNQGMGIIAGGYPQSRPVSCTTLAPTSTASALAGTLHYGTAAFGTRYYEQWTSSKAWSGTCRQVTVRLSDGTDHIAYFKFTK